MLMGDSQLSTSLQGGTLAQPDEPQVPFLSMPSLQAVDEALSKQALDGAPGTTRAGVQHSHPLTKELSNKIK